MSGLVRLPARLCRLGCLAFGFGAMALGGAVVLAAAIVMVLAACVILMGLWLIDPDEPAGGLW